MNKTEKRQVFFGKVKIARELLREKAELIFQEYMDVIQRAKDAGNYEVAAKHLQWLIDHMPADEGEDRMVGQSVDKVAPQIQQGPEAPRIQIGIKVGGVGDNLKTLPSASVEVIDAK